MCIEKDRIYDKSVFQGIPVGLFPSKDHNPCPVKLILEFCIDITLFLSKNPDSVAAIHCKAGKGRTGVMICCYLIFSGICRNTDEALALYAERRTINKKVTTTFFTTKGSHNCESSKIHSVLRNIFNDKFCDSLCKYGAENVEILYKREYY